MLILVQLGLRTTGGGYKWVLDQLLVKNFGLVNREGFTCMGIPNPNLCSLKQICNIHSQPNPNLLPKTFNSNTSKKLKLNYKIYKNNLHLDTFGFLRQLGIRMQVVCWCLEPQKTRDVICLALSKIVNFGIVTLAHVLFFSPSQKCKTCSILPNEHSIIKYQSETAYEWNTFTFETFVEK